MSTLPPERSIVLQPGLQAIEEIRNELSTCSATWTLVPSTMPGMVAQSPAGTTTSDGVWLPIVTVKVKLVPFVIPVPAVLQILTLPTFVSFVNVTDFLVPA